MQHISKEDAQKRVDQIAYFKAELDQLEQNDVLTLSEMQKISVNNFHQTLINSLAIAYDIDASVQEKQLSLGMKIASFLGALALAASIFFLFYQFWGVFSTLSQVIILIMAPMIGLGATVYAYYKEKTGYFAKLIGLVTLASFVLNISMFGQIFNITPSVNASLVWALFAFLLAYASDTRLLLAFGIIFFAGFLSAKVGTWSGIYWIYFGERPENFMPAAFLLFFISLLNHHRFSGFQVIYRVFAMLLFFIPVLILSNWGDISYIDAHYDTVEAFYQIIGFTFSAGAIWLGIKQHWGEVVNTGNVFFVIFLYTKFYDWWWEWMPKYLFFLIIALSSILILLVFKRLRTAAIASSQKVSS
ncbi:DUF2157 domain-containing protein [Sulfurovum sp. zt1-1]|uniref:DUF2157 domain-containing protein n=1 Tax=Sulfurovum zhangzhouensis TaxID=3019067 RepID=A0ABT7QYJ0_9BACT|nr:DUF2157 domain-containing protein [Sulfurovum zhangzhouensis]MDM5271901.1 DUF2157 domain-containing protein [Sulfurovum zhangzhouensis]